MTSKIAMITFYDAGDQVPVDPGYGVGGGHPSTGPIYGGGHPSHGLPGGPVYPSHGLPGGGHIALLPVFPFDPTRPDNSLPGEGTKPDQGLPGQGGGHPSHPIQIVPGARFVVKWLACQGLILVPDNSLPETPQPK